MKTKRHDGCSISEAARLCGVARKTIQRAVNDGRLSWVGPRRGRYASGLDVSEVFAMYGGDANREFLPAWRRAVENIERNGGDWRAVFGVLVNLCQQGGDADLDLIAACFDLIMKDEDDAPFQLRAFCQVIEGNDQNGFEFGNVGYRLGKAVKDAMDEQSLIDLSRWEPSQLWDGVRNLLRCPNPPQSQSRPLLVVSLSGKAPTLKAKISLRLEPTWDSNPSAQFIIEDSKLGLIRYSRFDADRRQYAGPWKMTWHIGRGSYLRAVFNSKISNVEVAFRARFANALRELEAVHDANPSRFYASALPLLVALLESDTGLNADWEYNEELAFNKDGYNRNQQIDDDLVASVGIGSQSLEAIRRIYRQTLPPQIRVRDVDANKTTSDRSAREIEQYGYENWEESAYLSGDENPLLDDVQPDGITAMDEENEDKADAKRLNSKLISFVMNMSYTSMRRQIGAID